MPIILAAGEVEIMRIAVQFSLGIRHKQETI
jgi:hypothetical protein